MSERYKYIARCKHCLELIEYLGLKKTEPYEVFQRLTLSQANGDEFNYCDSCEMVTRQELVAFEPEVWDG